MKVGDLVRVVRDYPSDVLRGQMAVVEREWDEGNIILLKFIVTGRAFWVKRKYVETPDDLT